jgi:hypothetical protein
VPRGLTRGAVLTSAAAVGVPILCAMAGRIPGEPWAVRAIFVWVALGAGVLGGFTGMGLGIASLVTKDEGRFASTAAILAGIAAAPFSLLCALVATGQFR